MSHGKKEVRPGRGGETSSTRPTMRSLTSAMGEDDAPRVDAAVDLFRGMSAAGMRLFWAQLEEAAADIAALLFQTSPKANGLHQKTAKSATRMTVGMFKSTASRVRAQEPEDDAEDELLAFQWYGTPYTVPRAVLVLVCLV
jgi:hypothetical protein